LALPFLWVSEIKEAYKGLLNGDILVEVIARATGTTEEECRRLLIEIGARGSLSEDEELWALLSRKPIIEQ